MLASPLNKRGRAGGGRAPSQPGHGSHKGGACLSPQTHRGEPSKSRNTTWHAWKYSTGTGADTKVESRPTGKRLPAAVSHRRHPAWRHDHGVVPLVNAIVIRLHVKQPSCCHMPSSPASTAHPVERPSYACHLHGTPSVRASVTPPCASSSHEAARGLSGSERLEEFSCHTSQEDQVKSRHLSRGSRSPHLA
jgi:hypothetical protein